MQQKFLLRNIKPEKMIELREITKIYTRGSVTFTALKNISFTIKKADYCTVVGPSGAGKSTLLNIIAGLVHPDSGKIYYNGSDIYQQKSGDLNNYRRKHLGFVFQQFYLMPYLTVAENIRLACHNKQHAGKLDSYLEKFSLSGMGNKYPSELSVGEKQRTAFIRAIITEPEILLADEPAGNLDPGNRSILMNLIGEYQRNGGTVILVTHDPSMSELSNINITLEMGMIQNITATRVSFTQK
jgi:putative ABC transport system ATP-binding protein